MNATVALSLCAELFELVGNALRQRRNAARSSAIVERGIYPQRAQHLHHVRLSGTIEAADPHRRLLGLFDVLEVSLENVDQSLFVLPIADKGVQFVPQYGQCLARLFVVNAGYALVDQLAGRWVFLVDVAIEHVFLPVIRILCQR